MQQFSRIAIPSLESSLGKSQHFVPSPTSISATRPTISSPVRSLPILTQQYALPPKQQKPIAKVAPRFSMRVASKEAYICRDCRYIYNERTPFAKLPDKYFCPVCGAPKRRFRVYEPPVNKDANSKDVRKQRKAQLQRDEAIGKALPIAIAVGVVVLAGIYFYLNSSIQG